MSTSTTILFYYYNKLTLLLKNLFNIKLYTSSIYEIKITIYILLTNNML